MFEKFKQSWETMPPNRKRLFAVVGAAAIVVSAIAIFQTEPQQRTRGTDPKTDQVKNVFTDRSARGETMDSMSGSIRRLQRENDQLRKDITALRNQEQRNNAKAQKDLESKLTAIEAQLQQLQTGGVAGRASADQLFNDPNAEGEQATEGDAKNTKRRRSLSISVIAEPEKKESARKTDKKNEKGESGTYIPAGSIITGTILTGGDFATNAGGFDNPTPLLIRISKEAILPNRYTSDIRECFLLTGGRGDLASERVKLRGEMLSCIRTDGSVIETKLDSYVAGEDGKEGVKGRLVSKQGQIIARSLVAGFASGLSDAFDVNQVPTITTSSDGTVQYEKVYSSDALQGAAVKGFSNSLERISQFYLDMAKDIFPVVEINAGRQVDVVVISGTQLKVTAEGVFENPYSKRWNR